MSARDLFLETIESLSMFWSQALDERGNKSLCLPRPDLSMKTSDDIKKKIEAGAKALIIDGKIYGDAEFNELLAHVSSDHPDGNNVSGYMHSRKNIFLELYSAIERGENPSGQAAILAAAMFKRMTEIIKQTNEPSVYLSKFPIDFEKIMPEGMKKIGELINTAMTYNDNWVEDQCEKESYLVRPDDKKFAANLENTDSIFFVDIDGTLLNQDGSLNAPLVATLMELKEKGASVIIWTADPDLEGKLKKLHEAGMPPELLSSYPDINEPGLPAKEKLDFLEIGGMRVHQKPLDASEKDCAAIFSHYAPEEDGEMDFSALLMGGSSAKTPIFIDDTQSDIVKMIKRGFDTIGKAICINPSPAGINQLRLGSGMSELSQSGASLNGSKVNVLKK